MNPFDRWINLCQIAMLAVLSGCAASGPVALRFTVRTASSTELDRAWEASAATLNALGYQVDDRDRSRGVLTAKSSEDKRVSASNSARGRSPMRIRRRVELRVKPVSAGVKMFCQVVIQHQTTEAHRWLAFDRTSSALPGRTPIARDSATTLAQNTRRHTARRATAAYRARLADRLDNWQVSTVFHGCRAQSPTGQSVRLGESENFSDNSVRADPNRRAAAFRINIRDQINADEALGR